MAKVGSRQFVTDLLKAWGGGDSYSEERLFSLVYPELKRLARRQLRHPGRIPLDTTSLVHETFLKLIDSSRVSVRDRSHFLALSARIMRQILIDHVRRRGALKRGGGERDLPLLTFAAAPARISAEDVLAMDGALRKLKVIDPRAAQLIELRFFGGLSMQDAADALGVSMTTLKRDWERTRAFLYKELRGKALV